MKQPDIKFVSMISKIGGKKFFNGNTFLRFSTRRLRKIEIQTVFKF